MYMIGPDANLSKRKKDTVIPFVLINLSHTENLRLKRDTVVTFAEKDETEGEVFHIETINTTPRHWTHPRTMRTFAQFARMDTDSEVEKIDTDIDLHKIFTSASNFIKSPAEDRKGKWIWKTRSSKQKLRRNSTTCATGMTT